jgi:hypothetical protein
LPAPLEPIKATTSPLSTDNVAAVEDVDP